MKTLTCSPFWILLIMVSLAGLQGSEDVRSFITNAYKKQDTAYAAINPEGLIAFLAPTLTVADEKGVSRIISRCEQLEAARYAVRTEAGKHFVRRQVTVLSEVAAKEDEANVHGTLIQELISTDQAGTIVFVRFSFQFQDEWERAAAGWLIKSSRRISPINKTAAAQPSPVLLGMLANMRQSNAALRSFNQANNFSTCMHANQNERFDYETRKAYCAP